MKKMQMKGQISRWHPTGKPGGWASLVLLRSMTSTATNDDPAGFSVPRAPDWYRFVLQQLAVAVTLSAPQTRGELDEDLRLLKADGPLTNEESRRTQ